MKSKGSVSDAGYVVARSSLACDSAAGEVGRNQTRGAPEAPPQHGTRATVGDVGAVMTVIVPPAPRWRAAGLPRALAVVAAGLALGAEQRWCTQEGTRAVCNADMDSSLRNVVIR